MKALTSIGIGVALALGVCSVANAVPIAAATTTTISSTNLDPDLADPVTLTATISSISTVNSGTVEFTDDGFIISGGGAVTVTNGTAQLTTTFSVAGDQSIEALYSGVAGTFTSSFSDLTEHVINPNAPVAVPLPGTVELFLPTLMILFGFELFRRRRITV